MYLGVSCLKKITFSFHVPARSPSLGVFPPVPTLTTSVDGHLLDPGKLIKYMYIVYFFEAEVESVTG